MKTVLLPDEKIRENVRQAMPGGVFAAIILGFGSAALLGLIPNLFGTNIVNLMGETAGLSAVGIAGVILSYFWHKQLLNIEYVAATKYSAEFDGEHLVVVGRSGRPTELKLATIKKIHFSGEYSKILKGATMLRRDRSEFDKLFSSRLLIYDDRKKHNFGAFFLSVDPDSFASIVEELVTLNPEIKVT